MLTINYISVWLRERGIPNDPDVSYHYEPPGVASTGDAITLFRPPASKKEEWIATIRAANNQTIVYVWGPTLLFDGLSRSISLTDPTSLEQITAATIGWRKIKFELLREIWRYVNTHDTGPTLHELKLDWYSGTPLRNLENWMKFAPAVLRRLKKLKKFRKLIEESQASQ